ncbi:3-isopropylmalate dehydratase small subunit [Selenihalanaerobacter shriftii]|uniref:3-isopropylmalate dehydratase small subunit n=1 Tax=Selenihalanaerobacter shriftii TaxID=142842 RepID=A0A1T4K1F1_9FIRM|nr:3-isopropylmalate dehydratase small subunit [Selenihalanaerobacter shriftii]SJZ36292.1 3-isopropylmalate dehydratase, small subunit [Selenihalanaerobacter shriftii]
MEEICGRVFKFGDNIDTDQIYPGRYLALTDHQEIAEHAMEGADPNFVQEVEDGDIIVGGSNFGCGSSREHAVICIKNTGVAAVIAKSFARIFYRNAINMGLPVIEVSELEVEEGNKVTVDLGAGKITKEDGTEYKFKSLPDNILEIIEAGGVINYNKEQNGQKDN